MSQVSLVTLAKDENGIKSKTRKHRTESEIMKRVTVVEDEGESVAKGMVIADAEVKTLEELKVGVYSNF